MSGVEFDVDQQMKQQFRPGPRISPQSASGGMAQWLVKVGIIKDPSQAGVILMAVVFINFLIAAFIVYKFVF